MGFLATQHDHKFTVGCFIIAQVLGRSHAVAGHIHVMRYAAYNALVIRTEPFILESMCNSLWFYNYMINLIKAPCDNVMEHIMEHLAQSFSIWGKNMFCLFHSKMDVACVESSSRFHFFKLWGVKITAESQVVRYYAASNHM